MQKNLSAFQIGLMAAVAAILIVFNVDSMWSQSVDLAHHYALAFRISENWTLTPGDPSIAEMNFYPRTSHILAAILGLIFNSTFLGIHLLSLIALVVLWGSVVFVLSTLPRRVASVSILALTTLLVLNRVVLRLEIHGAEIDDNFFFSQLVAQGMVLLILAVAVFVEVHSRISYAFGIFLVAAVYIVTGTHLLPALELLGVLLGIVILNAWTRSAGTLGNRVRTYLWYALIAISAIAATFLNPAFSAMRKISENNGALHLVRIPGAGMLVTLALLVAVVSLALMIIWWRSGKDTVRFNVALKYFGLYGGSIACLCICQIVLLRFGYGSEYAAKKYAFGLSTQLFISAAILIGLYFNRGRATEDQGGWSGNEHGLSLLVLASFTGIILLILPSSKRLDTSDVVSLEHQLIVLRDVGLSPSSAKQNVVIGLRNMSPVINYMFSVAVAKTYREFAIDVLMGNKLGNISSYGTILTSTGFAPYYRADCARSVASGAVSLVDATCMAESLAKPEICKGKLDFTSRGWMNASAIPGFSWAEDHGRWTDGRSAAITCSVSDDMPSRVKIRLAPFFYGSHRTQRLIVKVGSSSSEYSFAQENAPGSIDVALPQTRPDENLTIRLQMPDAISPMQAGMNPDERMLGFLIESVTFE
ncbi:hypothetical protein E6A55_14740 [Cupriavidus necator H16]|uniref:DUF7024 domain-containing protein n=2 Tax=Cupriavidus necator (strain ATCC 17699 / DSM 428 / KCTC 22496 / NCIMB 10442 / H16 / Stanier 337) TaxID=381666 RepID=A0AAE6DGV4_CUPNH|nr:hypothetical protein [Cupriavidus necator]QCC01736.1 hypothetical protein E6A55_14740 [Cupriavidus necator H16]QQB75433.1 hypothetical protein I6H87_11395 [Cupriavidus necator]WKA40134.1 hypothetical protein QWP09_14780 [Cupriavidus necator]